MQTQMEENMENDMEPGVREGGNNISYILDGHGHLSGNISGTTLHYGMDLYAHPYWSLGKPNIDSRLCGSCPEYLFHQWS